MNGSVYQKLKDGKPQKRADGTAIWCVEYVDRDGKRVTKSTFKAKKEAKDFLSQTSVDLKEGVHVADRDSVTVTAACDDWLKESESLERSTREQYERHVRLYIKPLLGDVRLTKLTVADVADFRQRLRAGETVKTVSPKGEEIEHDVKSSDAMVRKLMTSLRTVIAIAMERGKVGQNVAAQVRRSRKQKRTAADTSAPKLVIPTHDEMTTLLKTAKEHFPRYHTMLFLAAFTGMRASELRGLSWSKIDLEAAIITVDTRADEWGEMGAPKTDTSARTIPIGPKVVTALREWKLAQPAAERGKGLAFPNGRGNPESLSNLHHRFMRPLQEKAGLIGKEGPARFAWHDFRHFYASVLIANGHSVAQVQRLLGHASPAMTLNVYTHLFESRDRKSNPGADMERAILG